MPIPAGTGGQSGEGRFQVTREFRDVLGRPQHGWAKITSPTWGRATASVIDGILSMNLLPGTYEITTALWGPDEQMTRQTLSVDVPEPPATSPDTGR